jgi:predicted ATPase/DNA-binding SARP family transcriptional activator
VFRLRAFETGLNPGTTGGRTDRNRAERTLGDMDVLTTATEGSIVPVQIRLFGGVAAATDDGEPVDVGPAKCQAVLAVLALSPGSAVPVARIVRLVWGDRPPRTADKTLQSYVTRLRKGLGPDSIVRTGVAYRLDVAAASVDVARFQRSVGVDDTEAALAEWTGTPLAGLDADGLTATVDGLVEQYLGAVETDLARRIEADARSVVGPLTELTATYPFREGLWALLMTALYRVGRQADALAAYRRARHHLVEDLGVEPGPRLRELEALILGQDQQLGVDRSSRATTPGLPSGTVTFAFCDVEDSTRLWAAHGREMAEAMARHDALVTTAADRHGGYVFATGGDSFGVAFHRARDATAWAGELQAAMEGQQWPGHLEFGVRIGLHTGETEERGKGYFGPAVIIAARLAAAGHRGQTLVSGVTAALLDGANLGDLGRFRLEGVVGEQRILQLGDGRHPPLRTDGSRRGNIPRRLGRLIGRDDDLDLIGAALATSPIVTLVGPGGIGKTRLALAAADRADVDAGAAGGGGAWLVELAAHGSSSDVPRAVASVLDVRESVGRTLTASIVTALQSHRALLVLDNCEHVIDGAAAMARAVAEGCPDVRVLATSREGLGLRDEQLVVVAPLEPAGPGVELFNERAAAASAAFDPDADRDEVAEICRRLDGIPLAIELAAARTRSLSPVELVERLDDRLRLLTGGRRASVERHRTLRATIQWSFDLLTPAQQAMFRILSIFAGPFDRGAAEAIAVDADPVDVDDLLGDLADRSMLVVESGPFGRRFRLLETMRQFAAEQLAEDGDTDVLAARHARWCLDEVIAIRRLLEGHDEIQGVTRLDELWPNLRGAVDWACATGDLRLATALIGPVAAEIYLRSRSEIGDWAERILAITPPDHEDVIAFGLTWAARRYMRNLDLDGYERLVGRYGEPDRPMIRYARAFLTDDYEGRAEAAAWAVTELRRRGEHYVADLNELVAVGLTWLMSGRLEEHDALVTALVERFRVHGPPTGLQWALTYLGISASMQGRHLEAAQFYEEAAGVDVPDRTQTLKNPLAAAGALRRGDQSGAFHMLRSYIADVLDTDNVYVGKFACIEFVKMMVKVDRLPEAARILGFLEATDSLDLAGLQSRVTGPTAADPAIVRERATGRNLDDRGALTFMRDVLDRLLDDTSDARD